MAVPGKASLPYPTILKKEAEREERRRCLLCANRYPVPRCFGNPALYSESLMRRALLPCVSHRLGTRQTGRPTNFTSASPFGAFVGLDTLPQFAPQVQGRV